MNLNSANPFFSIILPTYNRSNFLPYAIESVIKQSYNSWELIIVDDGSTDKTKNIVDKYRKEDQRIKYFYQENQERSSARNNGIAKSTGDWICFLDSDDKFHKTHLSMFYQEITKNNHQIGIYFSGFSYSSYSKENEKYNLDYKNNVEFVMLNSISTPRACINNKILLEQKFNEQIKIGEDRELWSRILVKHPFFIHNKKTVIQIDHEYRSTNLGSELENIATIKKIIDANKLLISQKVKMKSLSNAYFNMSKRQIKESKIIRAIFFLFLSLVYNLNNKQTKHKCILLISMMFFPKSKILKQYK